VNEQFDVVYLPGGLWSPMTLRAHPPTLEFVRKSIDDDVIVAAICHASWILVSADLVKDRKVRIEIMIDLSKPSFSMRL
ncbi:MAG: DJ-1/PfpI family protein, partial [bacterium]